MNTNIVITGQTFLDEVPRIQKEIGELLKLPSLGERAEGRDIRVITENFPARHYKYQCTDWQENGEYIGTTQEIRAFEVKESKYRVTLFCVLSPEDMPNLYSNLERIAKESPLHNKAVFRLIHVAGTSGDLGAMVYDKQDENTILASKEYTFKKIFFGGK